MSGPFATINLEYLKQNALHIKRLVKHKPMLAMVKADAYGHGLVQVAKTLETLVDYLGVARVDEAITLRNHGIKTPIVLMTGITCLEDLEVVCRLNIDLVIHQFTHLALLKQLESSIAKPNIWLKINASLQRLGFRLEEVSTILEELKGLGIEKPAVIMTHLPALPSDHLDAVKEQIASFLEYVKPLNIPVSISNSAGIVFHAEYLLEHTDIFRPGRMLYGLSPINTVDAKTLGLQPVLSFFTNVIAINTVYAGESIGYDREYVTTEDERIAILEVGYADGYPRTTQGVVKYKDQLCPIRGWVSMDMMAISIPVDSEMQIGDTIELWGEDLPVESLSQEVGRMPLEIIMPLATRVKRIYIPTLIKNKNEHYEKEII